MSEVLQRLTVALADRYAVESEIGRGAMATVFLAEDLRHRRRVAIKVLDPAIASSLGADRFLREIEIVAGLDHPHILPLHDSGEADGLLFYVMPFVEGESLGDRLQRENQLPVDDAARIASEVADALAHAHRQGVIHRDIKPDNVLLSGDHARVADFGVARALTSAGTADMTAAGLAVGTPAYMSPEQAAGEEVDGRSDIYALGCVLYEMLAGEPPLVGTTAQSTAAKRLTDRPTSLPVLRDSVSPGLDAVVRRALRRAPADRFPTADDFATALKQARSEGDTRLPPDPEPSRTPLRRLTFVAVAVGFLLFAAWQLLPRLTDSAPDAAPTDGSDRARSIAVLPFENIGGADEDASFVDGVQVEIINRLAGIGGITTISRASVLGYREAPKPPADVARELDVAMVLEGTVQRTGDRIRFQAQLTDGTGRVVWAEPYDRKLTADNLFAIQSEIARQVTSALGAELSPAELRRIDRVPTGNLEAYDYWVRAYNQLNNLFEEEAAARLLESAIELDPEFAGAHSMLAAAYSSMFWKTGRTDDALCGRAREAIETARGLDPELTDVYVDAAWYYYRCFLDYDRALSSLDEALRLSPNSVEALEVMGLAYRRSGRIRESIDAHLRAVKLSPRYGDLHWHLKSSYSLVHMWDEARRHAERAISLVPSNANYYTDAAWVYYRKSADPAAAREVLGRAREVGIDGLTMTVWDAWLAILDGRAEAAIEAATSMPRDEILPDYAWNPPVRSRAHLLAEAHRLRGDNSAERAYLDSAHSVLTAAIAESDAAYLRSSLGVILAELGRKEEAIRQGTLATEMKTLDMDAWAATYMIENLAQIYVIAGDTNASLDLLEQLMAIPGDLTSAYLARSPTWEPLREQPRFQALLVGGE